MKALMHGLDAIASQDPLFELRGRIGVDRRHPEHAQRQGPLGLSKPARRARTPVLREELLFPRREPPIEILVGQPLESRAS